MGYSLGIRSIGAVRLAVPDPQLIISLYREITQGLDRVSVTVTKISAGQLYTLP